MNFDKLSGDVRQTDDIKGWMYILECSDGSYYTGSTNDLERRLEQHQNGEGANHTKKHLPVKLVYTEEFQRIDEAFYREKQVQGWSRKKKEALINGEFEKLPELSMAYRDLNKVVSVKSSSVVSRTSTTNTNPLLEHKPLPEALEGNIQHVVSRASTTGMNPLPEALEGNSNNELI